MMKKLMLFFFGLNFSVLSFAQEVNASLSNNAIKIGQQFYFELSVKEAGNVVWPRLKDTINKFIEIVDSVVETNAQKEIIAKKYLITCFDSGHYVIPSQLFLLNNSEVFTPPLEFDVHTVDVDTTKEFKDIKEIKTVSYNVKEEPEGFWAWIKKHWYIPTAVLVVLAAVIFFLLKRRKKQVEEVVPEIILPLHEQLIRDIELLQQKNLLQNGQVKLYFVELTDLLRTYIEKRYNVSALEQTTGELMNNLKTSGLLIEAREILKNILTTADMVKFAKASPSIEESSFAAENAKRFAVLTKLIDKPNNE